MLKNNKSTYKQLSEKFEVSTKTIERDINKLSSMGMPVYCVQGVGGGVYLDKNFKFSNSFFTNIDIQSIVLGLSIFDDFAKNPRKKEVLNKLYLLEPNIMYLLENDITEYFVPDIFDEKIDIENETCKNINYCMNEEVLLEISACNTKQLVAPISYILKIDGLYLYCFNKEYLLIKIDNIEYSIPTKTEFIRNFIPYKENQKYSR